MTTWRFNAHVLNNPESPLAVYPGLWDTEEENLQHLEEFMLDRKLDMEGHLDWVSLERSAVNAPYHAKWGEWREVIRLQS